MNRPTVLLDVDGVLADFVSGYLALLAEHTGIVRAPADVTSFDIAASLGLSPEQAARMKRAIDDAPHFARHLAVCPGAQEGVARLRKVAEVYVVTSPWNTNRTWTYDREQWLAEHFGIPHRRVVHTSAKHLVRGDVLVDDKTSTLREWQAAHRAGLAVQWVTLHNRHDSWNDTHTADWDALCEIVRSHGEAVLR